MDKTSLDNNIVNIQCKHKVLATELSDHLSAGTSKVVCLDRYNIATGYLLEILRAYKPFTSAVTYAYKFTFTRTANDTTSATISMVLKAGVPADIDVLTSYVGTGTGTDIAVHFETAIKAGGLTAVYEVERFNNVLYVYSYDTNVSYSKVGVATSNTTKVTAVAKSLENNLDEILNLQNILTKNELCNLIKFATAASGKTNGGSTTSSNGCNC